jgi:hypothetical protein
MTSLLSTIVTSYPPLFNIHWAVEIPKIPEPTMITLRGLELECTADGCVQYPEAVLAGLYLHVGPWLTVDVDNIAPERNGLVFGIKQCAITVILLRRQC